MGFDCLGCTRFGALAALSSAAGLITEAPKPVDTRAFALVAYGVAKGIWAALRVLYRAVAKLFLLSTP